MRNFNENYALVRALHAVPGVDNVDVYLNGSPFFYNVMFTNFTPYVYVPEGKYTMEVFPRDKKENPLIRTQVEFEAGQLVTTAIIPDGDNLEILPVVEEIEMPPAGKAKVRFIHLVPGGKPINVLLDEQRVVTDISYKEITPYIDIDPKTYQVGIELTENNRLIRELRVTINPDKIYSFYAIGEKPNFQIFQSLDGATFMN